MAGYNRLHPGTQGDLCGGFFPLAADNESPALFHSLTLLSDFLTKSPITKSFNSNMWESLKIPQNKTKAFILTSRHDSGRRTEGESPACCWSAPPRWSPGHTKEKAAQEVSEGALQEAVHAKQTHPRSL